MQRFIITTVLAASFAGTALAESPLAGHDTPFVPTATRAQVQAELDAFKRSGVNPWSTTYSLARDFRSTKTRGEVTADYLASREEVQAMTGEDGGSEWLRTAGQPSVTAGRLLASK
jgi:hypothetical protein